MLRKILLLLCCVFTLGTFAQSSELKFGHINTEEFITNMPETKEAMKKLDDLSKKYDAELQRYNEEFNRKYTEYASQADTLPPTIKARRAQEVSDLDQKIKNLREDAWSDLQKQRQELIVPIQDKVRKAIKEIADEQDLIYVFDTAQLLYYSSKSKDISPDLKKKLNIQ